MNYMKFIVSDSTLDFPKYFIVSKKINYIRTKRQTNEKKNLAC